MIFESFVFILLYIYSFYRIFNKDIRKICTFTILIAFISMYNATFLLQNDDLVYKKILLLNVLIILVHIIDHNMSKNEMNVSVYAFVMGIIIMLHGIILDDLYLLTTNYVNTIFLVVTAVFLCYCLEIVAKKLDDTHIINDIQLKTNYYLCLIIILSINYYSEFEFGKTVN